MKKVFVSLLALAVLCSGGVQAMAVTADISLEADARAEAEHSNKTNGQNENSRASIEGEGSIGIGGNEDINGNGTMADETQILMDSSDEETAGVDVGPVVIFRNKAMKDEAVRGSSSPEAVSTRGELETYITAVAQSDENFRSAEAAKNEVSVRYKERAKLFGFIPVAITAKAMADTDGNVRVRYPWYRFLLSLEDDKIQSRVESRVNAVLLSGGAQNTQAEFSAETQARLVNEIRQALRESYQGTTVEVNADASATTQTN